MENTMCIISNKKKMRQMETQNEIEQSSVIKIRRFSTCRDRHYRDLNAAWGACRYSWCGCRGFKGNTNYGCQNCGHSYRDHF